MSCQQTFKKLQVAKLTQAVYRVHMRYTFCYPFSLEVQREKVE